MSNRFDSFMKSAGKTPKHSDAQASKHSDAQASKQPNIQVSKAKSKSDGHIRTTVYLSKELHKRLKMAALDVDMDMSEISEKAIAEWLDKHSDV